MTTGGENTIKRGRKKGWLKEGALRATLPPVKVEKEFEAWLVAEMKRRKRSTMTDMIRVLLLEAKERQEGGGCG